MTRSFRNLVIAYFIFAFFGIGQSVFAAPLGTREILPNGLVLLHSQKTNLPIVKVVIAIKAGSLEDTAEKSGLAALTADLLNEGTAKRSSHEISDAIEFVGGSLGTSGGSDYITASLSVLKKDIELGFDLISDIVLNPVFSEQEIARRKTLLKNSIRQQREEPGIVASKAFLKAVYGDHPYGRPVEGTEETLDAITRQDIVDFHKAYYAPNNAVMAVVGDISRDELGKLLGRYFGRWNNREVRHKELPGIPRPDGHKTIKIQKALAQSNILLGHIGVSRDNPDYYALTVMNYILGGGGFASRLVENIRENRGLAYDVHSYFSANKYGGTFQAGLQTKNQSAGTAVEQVLHEMERLRSEPVSDKELEDAKSYLTGSFPLRLDSINKITGFLISVEQFGLGLDYVDNYKGYIQKVTREDVLRVSRKYLSTKDYFLVVVGDIEKTSLKD